MTGTIKEIMKKVEAFNELANGPVGTYETVMYFEEYYMSEEFSTWKEFQKFIKREYSKEVATEILHMTVTVSMDKDNEVTFRRWDHSIGTMKFQISVYQKY